MSHILSSDQDRNEIDELVFVGFKTKPDIETIRNAYIETAEVQVYKWLGVSSNEKYDERFRPPVATDAQREADRKIKLAVQFLTASKLLISFPQILEEKILNESVRFQNIDVYGKIRHFELECQFLLSDLVNTDLFRPSAVFSLITQRVAF